MQEHEGFISVSPALTYVGCCPRCGADLPASDWSIPGMWVMAKLTCEACARTWWADLPFGIGALAPCYLDIETGEVIRPEGPKWYADLTAKSWAQRQVIPVQLKVERRKKATNVCLVNCLYPWWGDGVNLHLRINQIHGHDALDIVVITTSNLLWLVPDYVAEVWIVEVDNPVRNSITAIWNESLSQEIKSLCALFENCYIPVIFQPASLLPGEVAEFTSVEPFPRHAWSEKLKASPVVTFIWRDDRSWHNEALIDWFARSFPNALRRRIAPLLARIAQTQQIHYVHQLTDKLKKALPNLDFGVIGIGTSTRLPDWFTDLRQDSVSPKTNVEWCERAAQSHILIGVHGSSISLPGLHAGAVIKLIPKDRYRNVLDDLLITCEDPREALFCYRLLPLGTSVDTMFETVMHILLNYPYMQDAYHKKYYRPLSNEELQQIRDQQRLRAEAVNRFASPSIEHLIGP